MVATLLARVVGLRRWTVCPLKCVYASLLPPESPTAQEGSGRPSDTQWLIPVYPLEVKLVATYIALKYVASRV